MMAFDMNDYEDCATLNKWFQGNFPIGSLRILKQEHHIITNKDGNIIDELFVVQTGAFRDVNDLQPATMNVARGKQSEYPKHMARFFAEDVTTSSYGRSIALLKATDKTATKDDMRKVDKTNYSPPGTRARAVEDVIRASFAADKKDPTAWSVGEVSNVIPFVTATVPNCKHGIMKLLEGVSKTTQKPYYGYVCTAPKAEQCEAKWAKIMDNGTYYFPSDAEEGKVE